MFIGHHFVPATFYPYTLYASVNGVSTTTCNFINTTRITCTLPNTNNFNNYLYVQVFSGSLTSNYQYLIRYAAPSSSTGRFISSSSSSTGTAAPTSIISSVWGCPVQSGSVTVACSYNSTVYLYGTNLPTGYSVTVSFSTSSPYYYYATTIVASFSSSMLVAQLPYFPISTTMTFNVQASNTSVATNSVPYVSYMSQAPYIYKITGCTGSSSTVNGTAGCTPLAVVTIDGHRSQHNTTSNPQFAFLFLSFSQLIVLPLSLFSSLQAITSFLPISPPASTPT